MTNNILDLQIQYLEKKIDPRGFLLKNFSSNFFPSFLRDKNLESFFTTSSKNVFRGFHYQIPPYDCDKIVTCVSGEVFDVVIDIRKESTSYLQIDTFHLKSSEPAALFVPKGCLHGFLCLTEQSTLHYLQNANYNQSCDSGYHLESFSIIWPHSEKFILSERDQNLKKFIL